MAERYRGYSEYTDSGVEWLGKVPAHWAVMQIKHLSTVKRGASPRPIDDAKYFDEDGEYAWTRIADVTASDMYLTESPQRLSALGSSLSVKLQPGSLFLSIAGTVGKPCIAGMKACIHDGFVYFPELKIPSKFLFYVFTGGQAYKGLGKFGTQLNLNTDTVGGIKIGVPESNELSRIVDFLDHETAKIDTLIEKQQQLITLLKEKRQAVISHAVTKGLNPDAPMKDSGVEWLGEVPEHWEVVMLGKKIQLQRGVDITKDQQSPGEIPVVSSGGISSYHNCSTCQGPGVVVGRKGTAGKLHYIETDFWAHDTTLYVKEFRGNLPRYVYYKLASMQLEDYDTGSANPTLNRNVIHPVKVSWCPLNEQQEIASYLDHFCSQEERVTEKSNCAIQLLQERRSALISAAVTGKIDVRNWQPPADTAVTKDTP